MKLNFRLVAICVAIFASGPSLAAQSQAFLPSQKAAAILADGFPWSADTPDGKTLQITLQKDGTGSIRGPMPMALSLTWIVKGDAMCLAGPMGTKCLRFREIPKGLQGWDGDTPDLKFSR